MFEEVKMVLCGTKKWCVFSQKLVYQRNASSYYFVANCMSASWNFVTNEVGINSNRTWVRHFELTFPQRGQNCRRHEDWIGHSCETREHAISFLSVFFHFFFLLGRFVRAKWCFTVPWVLVVTPVLLRRWFVLMCAYFMTTCKFKIKGSLTEIQLNDRI